MKKTTTARKLALHTSTVRVLSTSDLRDVVGGTTGSCTCDCPPPTFGPNTSTPYCQEK